MPCLSARALGAIASIAYGHRAPLVDGNVIRVMARLRAVGADPKNKEFIKFSWYSDASRSRRSLALNCCY